MHKSLDVETLNELTLYLEISRSRSGHLKDKLYAMGYQGADDVDDIGMLRWRGDTLTLWPIGQPTPCRIIFFDDEIESIHRLNDEGATAIENSRLHRYASPSSPKMRWSDCLERYPNASKSMVETFKPVDAFYQIEQWIVVSGSRRLPSSTLAPVMPSTTRQDMHCLFSERVKDNLLEWSDSALRRWENLEKRAPTPYCRTSTV